MIKTNKLYILGLLFSVSFNSIVLAKDAKSNVRSYKSKLNSNKYSTLKKMTVYGSALITMALAYIYQEEIYTKGIEIDAFLMKDFDATTWTGYLYRLLIKKSVRNIQKIFDISVLTQQHDEKKINAVLNKLFHHSQFKNILKHLADKLSKKEFNQSVKQLNELILTKADDEYVDKINEKVDDISKSICNLNDNVKSICKLYDNVTTNIFLNEKELNETNTKLNEIDANINAKANQKDLDQINKKLDQTNTKLNETDAKINAKANQTELDNALKLKADQTKVDAELNKKANKDQVDAALKVKADQTKVDAELNKKANKDQIDNALKLKADQTKVSELDKELKELKKIKEEAGKKSK